MDYNKMTKADLLLEIERLEEQIATKETSLIEAREEWTKADQTVRDLKEQVRQLDNANGRYKRELQDLEDTRASLRKELEIEQAVSRNVERVLLEAVERTFAGATGN